MPDVSIPPSRSLPGRIGVGRGDPVYIAHGYLTKVPVTAITPFIEAFTSLGDVVLDPFAGSGMTGVAAVMTGRRARLIDISVLGRHIGSNYLNLLDRDSLLAAGQNAIRLARQEVGDLYRVLCAKCGENGELSRRTWSRVIACESCTGAVNYYTALQTARWGRTRLACPHCGRDLVVKNARRLGEEPVMDTLVSSCSKRLLNQPPSSSVNRVNLAGLDIPDVPIPANRQMFQASALAKHNLTSVNRFYSDRNLAMLAALRKGIEAEENPAMREKLMFGFTAILTRASKRYQWSHRRPLNAANQTYYIAPVFYEWNVLDLFQRKLKAIARSDAHIQASLNGAWPGEIDARYEIASADLLPLCDESIDYVFTDPPFGSNIFYSDMNLFQEAWLRAFTDESKEAVVDRSHNVGAVRTPERYERILTDALIEAHRVLKPHGWLSLVFGNSSGAVWSMVQRAINKAGFVIDPEGLTLLDKGQRSVKGLNSGFERVVTIDLVMSMRKRLATDADIEFRPSEVAEAVDLILAGQTPLSPSEAYISVVRECLRRHWDLEPVSYAAVVRELERRKLKVDLTTGMFRSSD